MAGTQAWSVFGDIGLTGLGETSRKLGTFNALGASTGKTMFGLNKKALLLAGGIGAVGGAAGLLVAGGVRRFARFDDAMNQSLAIMGDVSSAMRNDMSEAARTVARETLFSAEEAAESYFFLASAGLDAEQSIAALPQVSKFAQAGMFDMARATDLATDAQSALGLTVDDATENLENLTRVTDVLVKANTLANASVEQFSTALTTEAGAALKTVNKDIEEGVAVLAAFADQGVKAEKAGNGLSRIIRIMNTQAVKNADAYERLGVRVFDAGGDMRNFADILEDLETAFDGMSDSQRSASLESLGFMARLQGVVLPLLGTSDAVREYESNLRDAKDVTGEISDNQLKSAISQWELLKDEIADVSTGMGKAVDETADLAEGLELLRTGVVRTREAFADFGSAIDAARFEIKQLTGIDLAAGDLSILRIANDFLSGADDIEEAVERMRNLEPLTPDDLPMTPRRVEDLDRPDLPDIRDLFQDITAEPDEGWQLPTPEPPDMDAMLGDISLRGSGGTPQLDAASREANKELEDLLTPDPGTGIKIDPDFVPGALDPVLQEHKRVFTGPFAADMKRAYQEAIASGLSSDEARQIAGKAIPEPLEDASDDAFSKLKPTFKQVGTDLMRGLASGTFDAGEFLKQTMLTVAGNFLLGPLQGFLGIASPSRVTAEMGHQMVAGLESGILEGARAGGVARAWGSVLSTIPSADSGRMIAAAGSMPAGIRLDASKMPPAKDPLSAARDRDWQDFLRESMDSARDDGRRE